MVVQPARSSPLTPFAEKADWMTACQNGDTALDQSSVLMSCIARRHRMLVRAAQSLEPGQCQAIALQI